MENNNKNDENALKNEDIDGVNGGKTITNNKVVTGNGNIIGDVSFNEMQSALDTLDKTGKLDYLKKK